MSKTSPEEIAWQHQEAERLLETGGLPYAALGEPQEIPLSKKTRPICQLVVDPEASKESDNDDDTAETNTIPPGDDDSPRLAPQALAPYWTTRGHANVSQLRELVREGYNVERPTILWVDDDDDDDNGEEKSDKDLSNKPKNGRRRKKVTEKDVLSKTDLWDPNNASVNNVWVTRPAHDEWGIHKIVLIFCDDFLRRIYEFPWYWQTDRTGLHEAVQPILETLQITPQRVVRLVLASMPPGKTIPYHEDSGHWVQHTHRIHVPILVHNPDRVVFRTGPTVHHLERIPTTEGHVFEINNQAKHAVSNCDTEFRVHLILDYVDEEFLKQRPVERFRLDPGETLLQTRRSIDRGKDRGSRPVPSFFILGAQKAGTTSLFECMIKHPLIVPPVRNRETHCLDWRWNDRLKTTKGRRNWCLQAYRARELEHFPSMLTGDSTPSYLLDSKRVIPRLKEVFDYDVVRRDEQYVHKFFAMLREPVKRAESHFAMVTDTKDLTPKKLKTRGTEWRDGRTFRQVAMEDLERMKDCGLIPYWDISKGTLDDQVFADFAGSEQENAAWNAYLEKIPLNTGSHSLVSRGLYELNLRPWMASFDPSQFLVFKLEDWKKEGGVHAALNRVWQHLDIPPVEVRDQSARNTREYDSLVDEDLRSYLQRFYEPHNQRLKLLLGEEEWKDPWPYNNKTS